MVVLIVGLIIVKKRTAVNNLLPAKLLPDPSFRIPLGDDEQTIFKTLMQNRFHLAVRHDHSLAEIAHLVAHRCHNPKVVSLMMIFNIVVDSGAPTIWQKGSRNFDSQNFKLRVSTPVTLSLGAAVFRLGGLGGLRRSQARREEARREARLVFAELLLAPAAAAAAAAAAASC